MFAVVGGFLKTKQVSAKPRRCIFLVFIPSSWFPQGPGTQHLKSKCLLDEWLWKEALEITTQS